MSGTPGADGNRDQDDVGLLTLIGRSISWHFDAGSSGGNGSEEGTSGFSRGKGEASQLLQMAKSNTMSGFRSIGSTVRQLHRQQRTSVSTTPTAEAQAASAAPTVVENSSGRGAGGFFGGDSWIMPKKYAPTDQMKCRALGNLDPAIYLSEGADELYEQPPGHAGRLWFVLNYSRETQQLAVTVAKARNLRPNDGSSRSSSGSGGAGGRETTQPADCYVRVSLEGGERRVHTTSVKRKTCNPNFDERFHFQIPQDSLESHSLHLTVCQIERQRRHRPLGFADFALADLLSFGKDCRIFRDLETAQLDAAERTEVRVSLTHHALMQRVTVGLHDCRNLPVREDDQQPMELYLRVSLHAGMQGREIKCKRTEAVSNGVFNESLIFNRFTDPKQSTIRIVLMQRCSGIGALFDRSLGSVVLGPELFTKGRELEHWQEMLANPEQPIVHWHAFSTDC